MKPLLEVKHLKTGFVSGKSEVIAVEGVSFTIEKGKTLGMVGESGCGKSVTSMAVMRLLDAKGKIYDGEILFKGENLLEKSNDDMRHIRGNSIAMIFQEPMTSLNPVFTVGNQLLEAIRLHLHLPGGQATQYAVEMLKKVGIPRPEAILKEHPHMLSGGMQQRVMIAMALLCNPELLIADEPTTALDVTIQAQILDLLKKLQKDMGTSILLITHDLGVMAEMADRIVVMYAGQVVEEADVYTLFDRPMHPYTQGLMGSVPHVEGSVKSRLVSIPGVVPLLTDMPQGCRFHNRCSFCSARCRTQTPPLVPGRENDHLVRCWKAAQEQAPLKEAVNA